MKCKRHCYTADTFFYTNEIIEKKKAYKKALLYFCEILSLEKIMNSLNSSFTNIKWCLFGILVIASAALAVWIVPFDKISVKGPNAAQARFAKIVAWDDSIKEIMFDKNSDALAAELNQIEPSY